MIARALRRAAFGVAAAALLAGGAAELAAQNTTTGMIRGRVTAAGEPLAAATVTARNTETGFERSTITDREGQFTVRLLPPGVYDVRSEMIGYRRADATQIRVTVGQTTTTNLTMAAQAIVVEGIDVRAEQVVDVSDASVQKTVGLEQIRELPSLGRDFTDFINLSGLVAPNPEVTTGGQFSIAGARPSQTNIQIDGVDANNAFFGENRGGSRIPFTFSLESIREFQVVANGYDVEYGNYSGGVVNVVTRSGSNEFGGSVYANMRNEALTAKDFLGEEPRDFQVNQVAGSFSGPIIRDRAFFLFSVDAQRRREPQTPVSRDYYLGFTDAEGNPTPDAARADSLTRFWQILETRYGVEDAASNYDPYSTTNDALTLFGRVDWNLNSDHRLSVRHNYSKFSNDNEAGTFNFGRNRGELFRDWSHSFVSELQSVLGASTFNVLRVQYATEDRPRQGLELRPGLQVNVLGSTQLGYGGAGISYYNRLDERKFQLINNLTHARGAHTLKLGFTGLWTHNDNWFTRAGSGVFEFRSLADFEAYRPYRYSRVLTVTGEVPQASFDVVELGVYAQDEWRVTPRLTATFGLRYDQERFLDPPGRVLEVESGLGQQTGIAPHDNDNISPRLALAYDLSGDGTAVVRAGAGYFYGRVPYVMGGNVNSTDIPVVQLICEGNILRGDPNAPPNAQNWANLDRSGLQNPFACAGTGGTLLPPEYAFWNEDFEFPETFKGNVGYERLLRQGTRLSLDLVYSRSTKLYTVRNINLRDPQFTLANEGGRVVFTPASQFGPGSASTQHLRNTTFSNVFVNYNDGRSQSFAGTLELNHRLTDAVNLSGSYTFTTAEDNSSFTCCTAFAGWSSPRIGVHGPNDIGAAGDESRAWGPSDFVRRHTFIATADARLPYGFRTSVFWRANSGNPWGPEQGGDLNGDGLAFNDRPFIFAPEDLPLAATGEAAEAMRSRYADILAENPCIGDHVGTIIPRNTCTQPWFSRLDMRVSRSFPTLSNQRAELQLDLFNVLNGLNSDWGRYVTVSTNRRNLLAPIRYDAATSRILYEVPTTFGDRRPAGADLLLQFQAQLALRYYF